MKKLSYIPSFVMIILGVIFLFSFTSYAEVFLLKDGKEIKGEIVSADDFSLKVKTDDKTITIRRIDIKSVKKEDIPEEFILTPKQRYERLKDNLKPQSAQGHYNLGLFCLRNNLDDLANEEFQKAREIDSSFDEKIKDLLLDLNNSLIRARYDVGVYYFNYGKYEEALEVFNEAMKDCSDKEWVKKFEKAIRDAKERLKDIPELKESTLSGKLKGGGTPIPYTDEMNEKITEYIKNLFSNDKERMGLKKAICSRYLSLGDNYFNEAEETDEPDKKWRYYYIAMNCYQIAGWEFPNESQSHIKIIYDKMHNYYRSKLKIPLDIPELKYMEEFIKGFESGTTEEIISLSWYIEKVRSLEEEAKQITRIESKKRKLEQMRNCYLILYNCFDKKIEVKKLAQKGIAKYYKAIYDLER